MGAKLWRMQLSPEMQRGKEGREISNLPSCPSIFSQYLPLTHSTGTGRQESLCGNERQCGQGSNSVNSMCKGPVVGGARATEKKKSQWSWPSDTVRGCQATWALQAPGPPPGCLGKSSTTPRSQSGVSDKPRLNLLQPPKEPWFGQ